LISLAVTALLDSKRIRRAHFNSGAGSILPICPEGFAIREVSLFVAIYHMKDRKATKKSKRQRRRIREIAYPGTAAAES
jgi:hypothetical protein